VLIVQQGTVEDVFRLAVFYTLYAVLLVEFILFCFSDTNSRTKKAENVDNKVISRYSSSWERLASVEIICIYNQFMGRQYSSYCK